MFIKKLSGLKCLAGCRVGRKGMASGITKENITFLSGLMDDLDWLFTHHYEIIFILLSTGLNTVQHFLLTVTNSMAFLSSTV